MYLKIIHIHKHLHESEFVQFSHLSTPSDTKRYHHSVDQICIFGNKGSYLSAHV